MVVWDVAARPAGEQFGYWREVICEAFVPLTPTRHRDVDGFSSRVDSPNSSARNRDGDTCCSRCACSNARCGASIPSAACWAWLPTSQVLRRRRKRSGALPGATGLVRLGSRFPCSKEYSESIVFDASFHQRMLVIFIHQEADGAAMHAVDRLLVAESPAQRFQHVAIAAERHHDVGVRFPNVAIGVAKAAERVLRLGAGACGEGKFHGRSLLIAPADLRLSLTYL